MIALIRLFARFQNEWSFLSSIPDKIPARMCMQLTESCLWLFTICSFLLLFAVSTQFISPENLNCQRQRDDLRIAGGQNEERQTDGWRKTEFQHFCLDYRQYVIYCGMKCNGVEKVEHTQTHTNPGLGWIFNEKRKEKFKDMWHILME